MRAKPIAAAWFFCGVLADPAAAQVNPESRVVIPGPHTIGWFVGKGLRIYDLGNAPDNCLKSTEPVAFPTDQRGRFVASLARNETEEYFYKHSGGSLGAEMPGVFEASAQANVDSERWNWTRTLSLVIHYFAPDDGKRLGSTVLTEKREAELRNIVAMKGSNPAAVVELIEQCGSHFVSQIFNARQVTVTLRIRNIAALKYESLKASAKGSGTIYGVKYKGDAAFNSEVARAIQEDRLTVEMDFLGVANADEFAKAVAGALKVPGAIGVPAETVKKKLASRPNPDAIDANVGAALVAAFKVVEAPKISGYEITSFSTIGFPRDLVRSWTQEKLKYYQQIEDEIALARRKNEDLVAILAKEDRRLEVVKKVDEPELVRARESGTIDKYIEQLKALGERCIAARADVRKVCLLTQFPRPAVLDKIPEELLEPRLHFEVRTAQSNQQNVLREKPTARLLFDGPVGYNVDMGLSGSKNERQDSLSRQANKQLNTAGPIDVVLVVQGRYLEEYRVRMVGRAFDLKRDEYPIPPSDPTEKSAAPNGERFEVIFSRLPSPLQEAKSAAEQSKYDVAYRADGNEMSKDALVSTVHKYREKRRSFRPKGYSTSGNVKRKQNYASYRDIFCGAVLLEVQDKLNAKPWVFHIADATWNSDTRGVQVKPESMTYGTVTLVSPFLVREPGAEKGELPIPGRCHSEWWQGPWYALPEQRRAAGWRR